MARPIRTGDMLPVLFVLEKMDDEIWTGIKNNIHVLVEATKEGDCEVETDSTEPRKRRFSQ